MSRSPVTAGDGQARVFFALWPDADTACALHASAEAMRKRYGGRVMRQDTLHLTLAFIGNIPRLRIADLQAVAGQLSAPDFDLTLDTLGEWQRKHIVWAGPATTPAALTTLVEDLHARLAASGFALEARTFVPHVTLLRNARCTDQRTSLLPVRHWRCDTLVLVESTLRASGAHYEVLARNTLSQP